MAYQQPPLHREHEWIEVDGGIGTIALPTTRKPRWRHCVCGRAQGWDTVTAGAAFGSVESVKAVSDLFSPSPAR